MTLKSFFQTLIFSSCVMISIPSAFAETEASLHISAEGINTQGFIEPKYAFCTMAEKNHTTSGENFNVGLRWDAGPEATQSYALIMVDDDVPADFSNANKEGKTLLAADARRPFYHWILANIPTKVTSIPAGAESNSLREKAPGATSYGVSAINDYSAEGKIRGGYDGPCPPWNDEVVHHYSFRIYALDVATIDGIDKMTGKQVMAAIKPHILAKGEIIGKYTTNPKLAGK